MRYKFVGLEELGDDLKKVVEAYPYVVVNYITQAGNAFKNETKKRTLALTKTHTGNLSKGYRSEVKTVGKNCMAEISGGNGKAFHFHLLENGHEGYSGYGRNRRHIGFVPGRYMLKSVYDEWEKSGKINKYAIRAINKALKKGDM